MKKNLNRQRRVIDINKIPENYQFISDTVLAVKYWIRELIQLSFAKHEIQLLVGRKLDLSIDLVEEFYNEVNEEIQLYYKKERVLEADKNKFADLLQTGLQKSLAQGDLKNYFRGVELFALLCGFKQNSINQAKELTGTLLSPELIDSIKKEPKLPGDE